MKRSLPKKFAESIEGVCLRRSGSGSDISAAEVACEVITGLSLDNPEEWAVIRDAVVLSVATARARLFLKRLASIDPDQYVIPFPGFQQAPPVIIVGGKLVPTLKSTLAEARAYVNWQEARVNGISERALKPELRMPTSCS